LYLIDHNTGSQLRSQLRSQLDSQLDSQLHSQLRSQLYSQLDSLSTDQQCELIKELLPHFKEQLQLIQSCFYVTTWWSAWAGFYEFGDYIGVKYDKQKYNLFKDFCEQVHFIIPFEGICFISDKPRVINWNDKGQLHSETYKAIEYEDTYGWTCLNGVNVPEKLVATPAHELTLDYYKELESADHRIEFVAKYGVERMKSLGTVIDTYENYKGHEYWDRYIFGKSKYKLIDMREVYNDDREAIFLGMVHQGNGMYIMECVGSGITTIKQALENRIEEDLTEYECADFH
jgi:hypothetical protein